MKRKILKVLIICFIVGSMMGSFVYSIGKPMIYNGVIKLNDTIISNNQRTYPFLKWREQVYIPLTWHQLRAIGMRLEKSSDGTFNLKKVETVFPSEVYLTEQPFQLKEYRIFNQSILLDNAVHEFNTPVLYVNNIIYIPLDKELRELFNISTNINLLKRIEQIKLKTEQIQERLVKKEYISFEDGSSQKYILNESGDGVIDHHTSNGNRYIGTLTDNKFSGEGVYYFASGNYYIGEFQDGLFHGLGRIYYSDDKREAVKRYEGGYSVDKSQKKWQGKKKVLIIGTHFKDQKLSVDMDVWEEKISTEVSAYYEKRSKDMLSLEIVGSFETTIDKSIVEISEKGNKDNQQMAYEALKKSYNMLNLKQYDTNYNGVIEPSELFIIHITPMNEKNEYHKSHRHSLIDFEANFGEVNIFDYVQLCEKNGEQVTSTMTVAHEISHLMGLPDLYDIDYSSDGLRDGSLMSVTTGHDQLYDPWSLLRLGWMEPTVLQVGVKKKLYSEVSGNHNIVKVAVDDGFLLFEKRDHIISRHLKDTQGILGYQVNPKIIEQKMEINEVNTDEENPGISLLQLKVFKPGDSIKINEKVLRFLKDDIISYEDLTN